MSKSVAFVLGVLTVAAGVVGYNLYKKRLEKAAEDAAQAQTENTE